MRRDSRLSVALHVLLHLSELGGAVTSEALGPRLRMNPVVLRRTLAGLRDARIVRSVKGHGGGWSIARPLADVTLADVLAALGPTTLFGIGEHDARTKCPIERAVNRTIGAALDEAEALLVARLASISVEAIIAGARTARRTKEIHHHA
jgi:Rrf2 family protein